jgi:hypothetical protein
MVVYILTGNQKMKLCAIEQAKTQKSHDEEIGRLHLDTADANARAETASLEMERLKSQFAWRSLDASTTARLFAAAKAHVAASVNLRLVDGDPEAQCLAIQIGDRLAKAGWQVAPGATNGPALPTTEHWSDITWRTSHKV